MITTGRKIRVLVVDDSAVMRKVIPQLLEKDGGIEVVATALDGIIALDKIKAALPDVITLDVDMPRMDGITTLGHIVQKFKIPVLMLSSYTARGATLTLRALEMGAVDFVCKPKSSSDISNMAGELISKVREASRSKYIHCEEHAHPVQVTRAGIKFHQPNGADSIIAIGASSGGPYALKYLLPKIPADFGAGIVIVQHMPENFTAVMARWLDAVCSLEVREANRGDVIRPGTVLIAPGSSHVRVHKTRLGGVIELDGTDPVNGHRPSVDVLFNSVAKEYGPKATAVILTGMGCDGADGIGEVKRAGGFTVAQDKESCSIFGMPKAAVERGNVDKVIPLMEMASYLLSVVGRTSA